jgi:apolipoprotein N-acyltransferase
MVLPISIFSIYGLSFVLMLINYALGLAAIRFFERRWRLDDRPELDGVAVKRWMATTAIVFAVWATIGLVTLAGAPKDAPTLRVAAVQHGFSKAGHMDPDTQPQRLQILSEQTRNAAQQGARFVL